ncbi:MAG: YraN family protein [Pseudomonadales bacterium]
MGNDRAAAPHSRSPSQRPITSTRTQQGAEAEEVAARYLRRKGLCIVERNFSCRLGEIDIVAAAQSHSQQLLVFAEVRLRNQLDFGSGAESVTHRKQQKLVRAAKYYLLKQGTAAADGGLPMCRFDVISMRHPNYTANAKWHIEWIQDAFEAI